MAAVWRAGPIGAAAVFALRLILDAFFVRWMLVRGGGVAAGVGFRATAAWSGLLVAAWGLREFSG